MYLYTFEKCKVQIKILWTQDKNLQYNKKEANKNFRQKTGKPESPVSKVLWCGNTRDSQ